MPPTERLKAEFGSLTAESPHVLAYDDLARIRRLLQSRSEVHPIAVDVSIRGDRQLADVNADAQGSGTLHRLVRLVELISQSHCRSDRRQSGFAVREGTITGELDEMAARVGHCAPGYLLKSRNEVEGLALVGRGEGCETDYIGKPDGGELSVQ